MQRKQQAEERLTRLANEGYWSSEAGVHSLRVGLKLALCSSDLGMSKEELKRVGELHDVGKTCIDQQILYTDRELTIQERSYITREHSIRGYYLLKGESRLIRTAARQHHFVDANGELWLQVLHLVDIEDACSNKRCYKEPMSAEKVFQIIEREGSKMPAAFAIWEKHWLQFLSLN